MAGRALVMPQGQGAAYGDLVIGTFIGGAILPSLLKQDRRYFYKVTGSTSGKLLTAILQEGR